MLGKTQRGSQRNYYLYILHFQGQRRTALVCKEYGQTQALGQTLGALKDSVSVCKENDQAQALGQTLGAFKDSVSVCKEYMAKHRDLQGMSAKFRYRRT
jgi:hypothetical protein